MSGRYRRMGIEFMDGTETAIGGSDRIDAIRERLTSATPGPWRIDENDPTSFDSIVSTANDEPWGWVEVARSLGPDSDLIANAPADLAYLLAELDKARAGLAEAWDEGWAARAKRPHLGMHESVPAPSHINPYRTERP